MKCLPPRKDKIHFRNVVGPQIQRLRYERNLSQEKLATKFQLQGYDCGREKLSKIEARLIWVADYELLFFAKMFELPMGDLFSRASEIPMNEIVERLLMRQ